MDNLAAVAIQACRDNVTLLVAALSNPNIENITFDGYDMILHKIEVEVNGETYVTWGMRKSDCNIDEVTKK